MTGKELPPPNFENTSIPGPASFRLWYGYERPAASAFWLIKSMTPLQKSATLWSSAGLSQFVDIKRPKSALVLDGFDKERSDRLMNPPFSGSRSIASPPAAFDEASQSLVIVW